MEQLASFLGLDALARRAPGPDVYPPYLLALGFVVLDFGVVNGYKMVTGYPHILVQTPTAVAGPIGVFLAAFGVRYVSNTYADAIDRVHSHNEEADVDFDPFEVLVPPRVAWGVYGVAVVTLYAVLYFLVGLENVVAFEGPAGLVNVLFVWEFGYLPFVVEFALLYFGVHFLVPRRIGQSDVRLFYFDPRNMGGFAGIGELLKRSYYVYTVGLLLYFLLVYGPFVLSIGTAASRPGPVTAAFFSAAWLVGLLSIAHSMLRMHQVMATDKDDRIRELEAELRSVVDDAHDINAAEITDHERFEDVQLRLEQVRETRVYPATFTMWSQIAISALLPQALQVAVQATA